jgi:hypothetical protein
MSRRHAYGGLPQIPDGYITAQMLAASAVSGDKLAGQVLVPLEVAGQDETSDNTITVTGISEGEELVLFGVFDPGILSVAVPTLHLRAPGDFTVQDNQLTVVANAANNSGNVYIIMWIDKTP